jgi:hypothetical protein
MGVLAESLPQRTRTKALISAEADCHEAAAE